MTDLQLSELKADLESIAGEILFITQTLSSIYALGSELAILRLFAKYQSNGKLWNAKVTMDKDNKNDMYYLHIEF